MSTGNIILCPDKTFSTKAFSNHYEYLHEEDAIVFDILGRVKETILDNGNSLSL